MSASTAMVSLHQLAELARRGPLRFAYLEVDGEKPWLVQLPGISVANEHFSRSHIGIGATVEEAAEQLHRGLLNPGDGWHVTVDALEIRGTAQRLVWTGEAWAAQTEADR
ncbi:hypothetical protein [Glutamicibacter sp. V16R2B1]|uniref:hypothetical protein n=1 Tax=Glutamicibacter sp. V16R2B1 TaxID=2036207 RepID=UPI0010FD59DD|nr:hypothetical protein [Glutamicibacter sp. V16R2B1]MCK9901222.1 hypothetical protein [Frankia sp. Cpl3]TLK47510.1 hypothetical protein FDN03_15750 [Glutamicibacter sp. V16R2B1]